MTNNTVAQAFFRPSTDMSQEDLYPIREVARLTGVNPVTLRAWERRYGLLVPHRTASGHRLYSMADIERVRSVLLWIERGVAVSKVASIIDRQAQLSATRAPTQVAATDLAADQAAIVFWQDKLVEAVTRFDQLQLDLLYAQVQGSYPLTVMLREVMMPVWRLFQDRQESGGESSHWAFLDAYLRGRLFQRLSYCGAALPRVMLVVLPGPNTELQALAAATLIQSADANVTYLPVCGSASELIDIAQQCACDVLVLYGSRAMKGEILKHLPRLQQAVDCPVTVLGAVCQIQPAEIRRAGLISLGDADEGLMGKMRALLAGGLDS